jgi:hypothetical protein
LRRHQTSWMHVGVSRITAYDDMQDTQSTYNSATVSCEIDAVRKHPQEESIVPLIPNDLSNLSHTNIAEIEVQICQGDDYVTTEEIEAMSSQLSKAQSSLERQLLILRQQIEEESRNLANLRKEVIATQDDLILQEVGVYEYQHPLNDSIAYKAKLSEIKDEIKTMCRKDGGAILASQNWQVNGSVTVGRKMVRELSKLMLRAYNSEVDTLISTLKPYKLSTAKERLNKTATVIATLGATMNISIAPPYHALRVQELELTSDYLAKRAEEKERAAEERARLREEAKVEEELRIEREKVLKEREHKQRAA